MKELALVDAYKRILFIKLSKDKLSLANFKFLNNEIK